MAEEKLADIIDICERRQRLQVRRREATDCTCDVQTNFETEQVELTYSTYIQAASMGIDEANTLAMKLLASIDDILGRRDGGGP